MHVTVYKESSWWPCTPICRTPHELVSALWRGCVLESFRVHVDVITRTLENRVVVPRKAVASRQGRTMVYRLLDDETVQEVEVVTGFENDSIVVIEEGLEIGDRLVVQGIEKLKDRSKVSIYRSIPVEVDELTVEPLQTEAKKSPEPMKSPKPNSAEGK